MEDLEDAVRRAVAAARDGATVCPSEVARDVAPADWRPLMQPVRDAAARLADAGEIEVTQGGRVVDVRTARGPVRLRRPATSRGPAPGA